MEKVLIPRGQLLKEKVSEYCRLQLINGFMSTFGCVYLIFSVILAIQFNFCLSIRNILKMISIQANSEDFGT